MTHEELQAYKERFNSVMQSPKRIRVKRLATLMEDLKRCYSIPARYNAQFAKANPEIVKLYRKVSEARYFGEVR